MKRHITLVAVIAAAALGACQSTPSSYAGANQVKAGPGAGEGWAYPPATETEIRVTHFGARSGVGPLERQYLVDRINMEMSVPVLSAPIVVQGVGETRDTLVVMVSGTDGALTPYIARALLARTTSVIRFAPVVTEMGLSEELDVYEVAAVLGFRQIVVTDGRKVTYVTQLEVSRAQDRPTANGVAFSPIRQPW